MILAEVEAEQTQPERSGDVEATQYMKKGQDGLFDKTVQKFYLGPIASRKYWIKVKEKQFDENCVPQYNIDLCRYTPYLQESLSRG